MKSEHEFIIDNVFFRIFRYVDRNSGNIIFEMFKSYYGWEIRRFLFENSVFDSLFQLPIFFKHYKKPFNIRDVEIMKAAVNVK